MYDCKCLSLRKLQQLRRTIANVYWIFQKSTFRAHAQFVRPAKTGVTASLLLSHQSFLWDCFNTFKPWNSRWILERLGTGLGGEQHPLAHNQAEHYKLYKSGSLLGFFPFSPQIEEFKMKCEITARRSAEVKCRRQTGGAIMSRQWMVNIIDSLSHITLTHTLIRRVLHSISVRSA